jgi:hypothetical protein
MKLGEMLIRDGRLTEEQLKRALDRQAQGGGRLGTVMVEMGLIDVDMLTVYLGLELGIPIATGATLERAKRTAVRLLSPAQARHFRCIPLIVQDRQLLAAMDDPHDIEALDELYRLTGYRIIPRVAPEIRIFYYLERYYGVPRPARFSVFGDSARGRTPSRDAANLPPPPLPGLPPLTEMPATQASARPIALITQHPARVAEVAEDAGSSVPEAASPTAEVSGPASPEGEALTSEAESLVSTLDADRTARADTAPPHPDSDAEPMDAAMSREQREREIFEPLALGPTIEVMKGATQRGDVADAIMSYAVSLFDVTALCVVRDNMAFGWKAHGPGVDRSRIEALLIPLDAPSMFRIAIHNESFFHAAPFPATLHSYLYRVLECQPPPWATVAAISIGKRVVNLLYGHRLDRDDLSDDELEGLRSACQAASDAYVHLIAASKRNGAG